MEAAVDGGSGNGVFATTVNANEGMVVAAPTTAAQLTKATTIAAATIGQRCHCQQCHCAIVPPSHHRLCRQWPPSTKTTIAVVAIDRRFRWQWPSLPPSMTNNDRWLLAVVIVNCVAAAMVVVDGGNSGRCQWRQQ
jgi:hypothetical protein